MFQVKCNTHRFGNVKLCLTWTAKCLCEVLNSFMEIYSLYWVKFVNYIKLIKTQGTGWYSINDTFMSFQKDGLLKYVKFEFPHVSSFSCNWKKDGNVFGKNTVTFWHNFAYKVNTFVFHYIWQSWLITYKNYSIPCTRKCKK